MVTQPGAGPKPFKHFLIQGASRPLPGKNFLYPACQRNLFSPACAAAEKSVYRHRIWWIECVIVNETDNQLSIAN
jgi:hypothetical protein